MEHRVRTIAAGFAFPEGPRWHRGSLWFADQLDGVVRRIAPDGALLEQFAVPGKPSGLGWLPGGDMLIVSMHERRLYRRHGTALHVHAELSSVHPHQSNDMLVDGAGNAYVGNVGFDFFAGEPVRATTIARVDVLGRVEAVADGLMCPNGMVIAPDGGTLIVAETLAERLTAYAIDAEGHLRDRRVFADLRGIGAPDGICLDAGGGVWAALPHAQAVVRVGAGGAITDRVRIAGANPYACMLGGPNRRELYACCALHHDPAHTLVQRGGRIDVTRVAVPGAGWP